MNSSDQGTAQRVEWDPKQRAGAVLDSLPFDGEEWSRVQSDGWHERLDMPGFYQREPVPGLTRPCVLTLRSRDLKPAETQQPAAAPFATLREDLAEALQIVRSARESGSAGPVKLVTLERLLQGIQAQVGP